MNYKIEKFFSFESIPKKTLKEIIRLYQEIFGSIDNNGGSWGEGAYCNKEGRSKTITLQEYKRLLKNNSTAKCSCGGNYVCFYPNEKVEEELNNVFRGGRGIVSILKKNNDIIGFSWGGCLNLKDTKYKLEKNQDIFIPASELKNENFIFEELAVKSSERVGIEPIYRLVFSIIDYAVGNKINELFFRTSRKVSIYSLGKKIGAKDISTSKNDIRILKLKNLKGILFWLKAIPLGFIKFALKV